MNVDDYKTLTKVLANRLENVLPKTIHPNQTGYVKGRYIGENTRLIHDLIFYLEKKKILLAWLFLWISRGKLSIPLSRIT